MDRALITALFGVLIVGASQVAESSMKRGSKARFAEFTGQFTRELLVLNPVAATSAGYHRHTDAQMGAAQALDEMLDDSSSSTASFMIKSGHAGVGVPGVRPAGGSGI